MAPGAERASENNTGVNPYLQWDSVGASQENQAVPADSHSCRSSQSVLSVPDNVEILVPSLALHLSSSSQMAVFTLQS